MTVDYDDLRAKALAATKGPWYAADWDEDDGPDTTTVEAREPEILGHGQSNIWPDGIAKQRVAITHDGERPLEDSAYIAAANPATVLSLLDEIAALKADAERYRWLRERANMDYPVRHGAPGVSVNMPTGNNACHYPVQSDLDAAIDRARSQGEGTRE